MELVISAAMAAAGLAALCYGGSWLVRGGVSVAQRFGLSPLLIGMTVVAYGTSTPELAASIAAGSEHGSIILGNVVGSNIANIGMVIGVAAILVPLTIGRKTLRREIPIMIGFSVLLVAVSADGLISHYDGWVLIGVLVAFSAYVCYTARHNREPEPAEDGAPSTIPKSVAIIAAGIVTLYAGSIATIEGAVALAEGFGISERVIGITVVAIGTSLPELITSIIAIRRGQTGIGVGNIIGSNVYNVLMIVGISSAAFSIGVEGEVFADYAIMIAFSAALLIALYTKKIGRAGGMVLVAAYALYLATVALR